MAQKGERATKEEKKSWPIKKLCVESGKNVRRDPGGEKSRIKVWADKFRKLDIPDKYATMVAVLVDRETGKHLDAIRSVVTENQDEIMRRLEVLMGHGMPKIKRSVLSTKKTK